MNQPSTTSGKPTARAPVFFWLTIVQLALCLLGGIAAAVWLGFEARSINRSGGWGWLLVGALFVVVTTVVCASCAICAAVSLFRRERHRQLSTVILVISGFVVLVFGPVLFRTVRQLRHQHDLTARASESSPRPSAGNQRQENGPSIADPSLNAPVTGVVENPQIQELKSRVWEAIRAKNADALVDCFFIEDRFNTTEIRQENRNQAELLLNGETAAVEIRAIPARELAEIMKIQNARAAGALRYSLVPKMMLRIDQTVGNGRRGRSFLIGEQQGKWFIVTLAGHTT